jgi:hypothetical protein
VLLDERGVAPENVAENAQALHHHLRNVLL